MGPADEITAVETVLRDLIETVLAAEFGAGWLDHTATPQRIERWQERRAAEAKKRDGVVTEERLLHYSDFSDLSTIIRTHWRLFEGCFGDRKTFDTYME